MNFIPVSEIPEKKTGKVPMVGYKSVYNYLMEFMKMNVKYAKVSFTPIDYTSVSSAADSLRTSIDRCGIPAKVALRGDDLYIIRTDMGE